MQRRHAAGFSDQPLFAVQCDKQIAQVQGRVALQRNPDARCGVFGRLLNLFRLCGDDALHLQKRKDPVQIISGQDPFTRQVDVADLICKCRRAEVDSAGVQILGKCAASSRRFVMFVSIVMICPPFLGRTFITLNERKVKSDYLLPNIIYSFPVGLVLFRYIYLVNTTIHHR